MARVAVWCSICGKGLYECDCNFQAKAQALSPQQALQNICGLSQAMRSDNPPAKDIALFREMAETLYGPHPADLLADALEVNIRSVQRWLAGQNRVPDAIWDRMYQLLRGAEAACQRLLGKANDSAL